jgi:hypothetical protein
MPGPTKSRNTHVGDRSLEVGRRIEDGKSVRRNRQEGRKRETATAPACGKASKWESRERCGGGTLSARIGRDQTAMRDEPGRRIEPSRKARRGSVGPCAVETRNLRRAIAGGRSPRGDRCEGSMGRPNARRDADPDERCPGSTKAEQGPRATRTNAGRQVIPVEGMTAPTTIPESRAKAGRAAARTWPHLPVRLKALKGASAGNSCPTRLFQSGAGVESRGFRRADSRPYFLAAWVR